MPIKITIKIITLVCFLNCWMSLCSAQQGLSVGGTVRNENNNFLSGVSVKIKDANQGTLTDSNGRYTLSIPSKDAVITFSSVGFITKEISVNGISTIDVILSTDSKLLGEVQIVGYGTQRKVATTGSIVSVKGSKIVQTPVVNIAQGLQARVSGLQINQNSAAPGGSISVRIRGSNSISGISEPLYVVDGIPLSNSGGVNDASSLSAINPNDIESAEVLKDASATAIYGARGANGVILITTKRGKAGATKVTYDGYYGVQHVTKKLDVLDAAEFAALENEIYKTNIYADPASLGKGTDWQDVMFKTAPIQSHQLSVSGGSEKTQIALSLNYFNQEGVILNTDFTRYSLRLNADHQISRIFKMGISILGSYSINNASSPAATDLSTGIVNSILGATLGAPPTLKPYRDDGTPYPFLDQLSGRYKETVSPLGLALILNRQKINNTYTNLYAEAAIAKGLTYRASFNAVLSSGLGDLYSPLARLSTSEITPTSGSGAKRNSNSSVLLHESILNYSKKLGNDHSIGLTGVFSTQENQTNGNNINSIGFPNDATQNEALQLALSTTVNSTRAKEDLTSYMGRFHYGYKDKYFLDFTNTYDGATKFGANNKYGYFPSIAAAWRITQESFMDNLPFISDLKLRASYGVTGNAASISPYNSLALVTSSGGTNLNHQYLTGISPVGIPNPDLRWERSRQSNIGFDLGLFKNRINIIMDVYNKDTKDLLYVKTLPLSSGYTSITGNFAGIKNKGVEIAVNASILNRAVKWNVSGNISFNRNTITNLDGGTTNETFVNTFTILKVGEPIGLFKTYVYGGIYQTGETLIPGSDSRIGGVKLLDINGDGTITAGDQKIVGDPNPNYIFGFSTDLQFKNFDFSTFLSGSQGNDIYNLSRDTYENPLGNRNVLGGARNRWSPTNSSNDFVSGFQGGRIPLSSRFVEDGSYIRCKNITLGYTIHGIKTISSIRLYISSNNLFTITKYSGYDPEVNSYGNSNSQIGIDNLVYPAARTLLAGLQINF